jgi:hypothetical protein
MAELYLTIAHMCRRYHIILYNTEPEDVCRVKIVDHYILPNYLD